LVSPPHTLSLFLSL